jgi:hypothetical protein
LGIGAGLLLVYGTEGGSALLNFIGTRGRKLEGASTNVVGALDPSEI